MQRSSHDHRPTGGHKANLSMCDMEPLVSSMPSGAVGNTEGPLPTSDSLGNLALSPSLLPGMHSLADADYLANLTEELKHEFKNDVEGGVYGDADESLGMV
jgi:hypothetical protein